MLTFFTQSETMFMQMKIALNATVLDYPVGSQTLKYQIKPSKFKCLSLCHLL